MSQEYDYTDDTSRTISSDTISSGDTSSWDISYGEMRLENVILQDVWVPGWGFFRPEVDIPLDKWWPKIV